MARFALLLARLHAAEEFTIFTPRATSIAEVRAAFKAARSRCEHPEIAELELWESDRGRVGRVEFKPLPSATSELPPNPSADPNISDNPRSPAPTDGSPQDDGPTLQLPPPDAEPPRLRGRAR